MDYHDELAKSKSREYAKNEGWTNYRNERILRSSYYERGLRWVAVQATVDQWDIHDFI